MLRFEVNCSQYSLKEGILSTKRRDNCCGNNCEQKSNVFCSHKRHKIGEGSWCSGLTCLPVTEEIAGSNPVGPAIKNTSGLNQGCFFIGRLPGFERQCQWHWPPRSPRTSESKLGWNRSAHFALDPRQIRSGPPSGQKLAIMLLYSHVRFP